MLDHIENLKIVSILHRVAKPYTKIESRNTHSFIIRVHGSMFYDFYDRNFVTNEGEMIFLPKGSAYTAHALADDPLYTAIHFEADFTEKPEPACYSLEKFYEADYIINCIADMWNFGTSSEKYKCISLFYSLLSYLSTLENASSCNEKKFELIDPAVSYLKEHLYDCTLTAERLHRLCGISNTYFRQIFVSRFGTTPQNYIISKRISHAMSIIRSGDYNTIGEVALSIGFNDPLYFSKVFKKTYGISPSDINKG